MDGQLSKKLTAPFSKKPMAGIIAVPAQSARPPTDESACSDENHQNKSNPEEPPQNTH
jgi:hypothetical protein